VNLCNCGQNIDSFSLAVAMMPIWAYWERQESLGIEGSKGCGKSYLFR